MDESDSAKKESGTETLLSLSLSLSLLILFAKSLASSDITLRVLRYHNLFAAADIQDVSKAGCGSSQWVRSVFITSSSPKNVSYELLSIWQPCRWLWWIDQNVHTSDLSITVRF
jgi:hypothetical protein